MIDLQKVIHAMTTEAEEMEAAAKVAASHALYESGAVLRNKAAGIRRAIEILQTHSA